MSNNVEEVLSTADLGLSHEDETENLLVETDNEQLAEEKISVTVDDVPQAVIEGALKNNGGEATESNKSKKERKHHHHHKSKKEEDQKAAPDGLKKWKQLKKTLPWRGGVRLPPAGPNLLKVKNEWQEKLGQVGLTRSCFGVSHNWERELWGRRNVPLLAERYNFEVLHFLIGVPLLLLLFIGAWTAMKMLLEPYGVGFGSYAATVGFGWYFMVTFFLLFLLAWVSWAWQLCQLFKLQRDYRRAIIADEELGWRELRSPVVEPSGSKNGGDYGATLQCGAVSIV